MHSTDLKDYLDMHTFLERYSQFNKNQMRWFVVKSKENGLAPAIKRLGRRLYFHVPTFTKWIEEQNA